MSFIRLKRAAVEAIATNHVISSLDDSLRKEVQILQLAGNDKLENLLELIETKIEGNLFSVSAVKEDGQIYGAVAAASGATGYDNRLDKLEKMMERVMTKLDSPAPTRDRRTFTCEHCDKSGHTKTRCFQLKTCYNCQQVGHISKF